MNQTNFSFIKLTATESLLAEMSEKSCRNQAALEEVQLQLATQVALNTSLQEEMQRFGG